MRIRLFLFILAAVFINACSKPAPPREGTAGPAPVQYQVKFETSKGPFTIEVHRDWAPFGADRFYELVESHFFDDARFFRVLKGFVVQFGINKSPSISARWHSMNLVDDPVKESNRRGTITYAMAGPNTRTTQVFINLADNRRLDGDGFAPFGKVIEGMDVVDSLYGGYGEGAPQGAGPDQNQIETRGNEYLNDHYPRLDYVKTATIVK
jgi:peptidyl-prolyl cis-trans isomerase A (cyclophilin A)